MCYELRPRGGQVSAEGPALAKDRPAVIDGVFYLDARVIAYQTRDAINRHV